METTLNKINDCTYELLISVPYSDLTQDFEEAYKKESKELTYPGFRKGKAPISLIKKAYKKEIEEYTAKNVADKFIEDAIKNTGFTLLNKSILKDLKVNFDQDVNYTVEVEIIPELELKDYKGLEIEKENFILEPTYFELILKDMKKPYAELTVVDKVEDKDCIVVFDITTDPNDNQEINVIADRLYDAYFPNDKIEKNNIDLTSHKLKKEFSDPFVGKSTGDTVELIDTHEHKHGDHVHKHEVKIEVKINKIYKVNYKDLTEEQIKQLSQNKCTDLAGLTELIEKDYKQYYQNLSETNADNKLFRTIIDNNPFEVPQRFLYETLYKLAQDERKKLTPELNKMVNDNLLYEYVYPKAVENVKWFIISKNIERIENLGFSEEEFENFLKERHEKTGIDIEKLRAYYKESKRHEQEIDQKVIKFVKENNTFKTVDVPLKGE